MATGGSAYSPEDADSRTASIPTKRPSNAMDSDIVGQEKREQSPSSKCAKYTCEASAGDSHYSFTPIRAISGESSERNGEEQDSVSLGDHSDVYVVDIRDNNGSQGPLRGTRRLERNLHQENAAFTALVNFDLSMPIADILAMVPSKKDVPDNVGFAKHLLPVNDNKDYMKRLTQAVHNYREARNRKSNVESRGKKNTEFEERALHDAEVSLAWCQYYPLCWRWVRPPVLQKYPQLDGPSATTKARERFFELVDKCLREGSLLDLRAGKFGDVNALAAEMTAGEPDRQDLRSQDMRAVAKQIKLARQRRNRAQQAKKHDKATGQAQRISLLEVDMKYCKYYPSDKRYVSLLTFKQIGMNLSKNKKDVSAPDDSAADLWKLLKTKWSTPKLEAIRAGQGQNAILNGDSGETERTSGPTRVSYTSSSSSGPAGDVSDEDVHDVTKSPNDDFVERISLSPDGELFVTNIANHDEKDGGVSGEISTGTDNAFRRNSNLPNCDSAPEGQTSNLCPQRGASDAKSGRKAQTRVLSDLSPEDLNAQMRYFHFSKGPEDIALDAPVRCLCCGGKGHMAVDCEDLMCSKCGAYNMHTSPNCDTERKCAKCRETGHEESKCPYKLKNLTPLEKLCGLCKSRGHFSDDCELFWRTSGAPWEAKLDFHNLHVFCYECGRQGHLGNDCTSRQPGKPLGTSSWSMKRKPPPPTIPAPKPAASNAQELSIRGNAKKPKLATDESDPSNFTKPKPSQPDRQGRIQINSSVANSSTVDSSQPLPATRREAINKNNRPPRGAAPPRQAGRPPPNRFFSQPPLPPGPPPSSGNRNRYPDYEVDLQYQYNQHPPASYHQRSYQQPDGDSLRGPPPQPLPAMGKYTVQMPHQQDTHGPPGGQFYSWKR